MPTPEPNVSIYAKLVFHALFAGFKELQLDSVGTFMFFGVSEILNESAISGRDILRFKRLCKDVILEANTQFLFTQDSSPHLRSLTSILEAEDPPPPKSKAPSCRSEWYQNVLSRFFDVYDSRYAQRESVSKFLDSWQDSYLFRVETEPKRNVFASRFKEAFDPINKRYRSPVRFRTTLGTSSQLALALPEPAAVAPVPKPHQELREQLASDVEEPIVQEQPPIEVTEADLSVESMEAAVQDVMTGISKPPEPPPVKRVRKDMTWEDFLKLNVQEKLTLDPKVLSGEEYNWRHYSSSFCRYPSVGFYEGDFIMAAILYKEPELDNRTVQTHGFICVNGGKRVLQSSMKQLMNIEATVAPYPSCFINAAPLQAGISGKMWCHVNGGEDIKGSHQWFIVLKRGEAAPDKTFKILDSNKHFVMWLVPEITFSLFNKRYLAQANKIRP